VVFLELPSLGIKKKRGCRDDSNWLNAVNDSAKVPWVPELSWLLFGGIGIGIGTRIGIGGAPCCHAGAMQCTSCISQR
jgi:hypothetical protein